MIFQQICGFRAKLGLAAGDRALWVITEGALKRPTIDDISQNCRFVSESGGREKKEGSKTVVFQKCSGPARPQGASPGDKTPRESTPLGVLAHCLFAACCPHEAQSTLRFNLSSRTSSAEQRAEPGPPPRARARRRRPPATITWSTWCSGSSPDVSCSSSFSLGKARSPWRVPCPRQARQKANR